MIIHKWQRKQKEYIRRIWFETISTDEMKEKSYMQFSDIPERKKLYKIHDFMKECSNLSRWSKV